MGICKKQKNPSDPFDETITYLTGDIVHRENPIPRHWSFVYCKTNLAPAFLILMTGLAQTI